MARRQNTAKVVTTGNKSYGGQAACRRHHVLLGDAELQEALGMAFAEMMHARAARDVGVEHDELGKFVGEAGQRFAERFAQGIAACADQGGCFSGR